MDGQEEKNLWKIKKQNEIKMYKRPFQLNAVISLRNFADLTAFL